MAEEEGDKKSETAGNSAGQQESPAPEPGEKGGDGEKAAAPQGDPAPVGDGADGNPDEPATAAEADAGADAQEPADAGPEPQPPAEVEFPHKIRQPLVSVMGHVDHGKTSLLDAIRGTTVVEREPGRITQHIGATEVPIETIYEICGKLIGSRKFRVPGLLFIDTPGHHSFTTLRARGGALSDLAVLVIDINEGLKPQTIESINILKRAKTPFIIALNKIDAMTGWISENNRPFILGLARQREEVQKALEERMYEISGKLYDLGFSADRYDKVQDFTKNIAMVPVSAKKSEGIADLLLVLVGLAQKFLEEHLRSEEGAGEGTILEVKEEKGLGATVDVIIYKGTISKGDAIILSGAGGKAIVSKVKAILRPKPLDEIRSPQDRFLSVKSASAAAGLKLSAPDIDGAMAGGTIRVVEPGMSREDIIAEIEQESKATVELAEEGVLVKADAIGSLEAIAFECKNANIPIKKAEVGDLSRRDIVEAGAITNPLCRAIFTFTVGILPDAKTELPKHDVKLFESDVIYRLIEDYQKWVEAKKTEIESDMRKEIVFPCKVKVLPGCVFRASKPAIVGVRILAGKLRSGSGLLRDDGREVGRIKSIQSESKTVDVAPLGAEVAISIEGATVGRSFDVNDILLTDLPEGDVKKLADYELTFEEKEALDKLTELKRKERPFWGM